MTDDEIIRLWLHGRAASTRLGYQSDVERLRRAVGKPLAEMTLADLQRFQDSLASLSPGYQVRILTSIRSLFSFATRNLLLPVNVAAALKIPRPKDGLTERILPEEIVRAMIAGEPHRRNRALLKLLYGAGLRAAELCALQWRDVAPRGEGGQITVYGKGERTRVILLTPDVWQEVIALRGLAGPEGPVFRSRRRGPMHPSAVYRVVAGAAARVGVQASPHYLRHAHASHALDHGAPIHLVQATLGHQNVATTSKYLHARPDMSSGQYLSME